MKTIGKLFLAAAVAFGLMACNKEEVPEVVQGPEATVSVKVVPTGLTPTTRLTGDLSGDGIAAAGLTEESAIKNVEVWLFAGEVPNGYKKGDDGKLEVTGIETTAGTRTMVVAANANIGEVGSKADLLAKIANLSQDVSMGLVMTAEPKDLAIAKGHNQYGYEKTPGINNLSEAKLQITRINARVALVNLTYEFPDDSPIKKFELEEVTMFNARATSKFFGASLVNGKEFLFGEKYPSELKSYVGCEGYAGTMTGTKDENLKQVYTGTPNAKTLITPNNAHYFYAFENDETVANQTYLELKGKLYKEDGTPYVAPDLNTDENDYTYYKIIVNEKGGKSSYQGSYQGDGTIKRNTQYNISVVIKGPGSDNNDEKEKAQLDVQVEVTPWIVVGQKVEW